MIVPRAPAAQFESSFLNTSTYSAATRSGRLRGECGGALHGRRNADDNQCQHSQSHREDRNPSNQLRPPFHPSTERRPICTSLSRFEPPHVSPSAAHTTAGGCGRRCCCPPHQPQSAVPARPQGPRGRRTPQQPRRTTAKHISSLLTEGVLLDPEPSSSRLPPRRPGIDTSPPGGGWRAHIPPRRRTRGHRGHRRSRPRQGCTASTCSAAMISVVGSPADASCTVTETIAPVSRSTPCSALCARRVRPSFIFAIFASGSVGDCHSLFDVFLFFRDRSNRANSTRVGVSTPEASANRRHERLVRFARVPPLDAPHRRVRFQARSPTFTTGCYTPCT